MLGQSDVTEARVIDQALVVSSPRSGVMRFGCRHPLLGVEKRHRQRRGRASGNVRETSLGIIWTDISRRIAPLRCVGSFFLMLVPASDFLPTSKERLAPQSGIRGGRYPMSTRTNCHRMPSWVLAAILALGSLLAACEEQATEEQSSAPTETEEQSESTTTQ